MPCYSWATLSHAAKRPFPSGPNRTSFTSKIAANRDNYCDSQPARSSNHQTRCGQSFGYLARPGRADGSPPSHEGMRAFFLPQMIGPHSRSAKRAVEGLKLPAGLSIRRAPKLGRCFTRRGQTGPVFATAHGCVLKLGRCFARRGQTVPLNCARTQEDCTKGPPFSPSWGIGASLN